MKKGPQYDICYFPENEAVDNRWDSFTMWHVNVGQIFKYPGSEYDQILNASEI